MGKLVFSRKESGGFVVLEIGGTVDTGVAPQLEQEMEKAVKQGTKFIGDLAGLEHLTSAGIGVLIAMKDRISSNGGNFVLTNVNEKIAKVFKLLDLPKLIQVVDTLEAAKKAL